MVYKTCNVPVFVDKDVTRMEIGELKTEWPITTFPLNVVMRECLEHCFSSHLAKTVFCTVSCIQIAKKEVVMECEDVCDKGLSTGMCFISRYRSWGALIL
jgi:hypothetical protein